MTCSDNPSRVCDKVIIRIEIKIEKNLKRLSETINMSILHECICRQIRIKNVFYDESIIAPDKNPNIGVIK